MILLDMIYMDVQNIWIKLALSIIEKFASGIFHKNFKCAFFSFF